MQNVCRNRTLAHGPAGCIQQCADCGVLSVHLGAVTLRIDPATAEALWSTLGDALRELHADLSLPRAPMGSA